MQRRTFIRLAGGGLVCTAAAAGAGAYALRSGYPAQAVEAWQGPSAAEADPRRRALAYAITAPNPHNLQPWLADLREPGVITVHTDPERVLPQTDPFGRQILIGHGAFLELLVMALAEQGFGAEVALWPDGALPAGLDGWDRRPVARLRLVPGGVADPLFTQVLRRRTPKSDYDTARPVAPATLRALLDAAGPSVDRAGTVDADRLPALRRLCWESAKVELLTPATVMESVHLTRVGPSEILRHRDGISINTAVPRIAAALGQFDRSAPPPPGSPAYDQMMARFRGHSDSAMGFVWLATRAQRHADAVAAGRAYVRLQLQATALGVAVHPMSQALQEFPEMAACREQAHRLTLGRGAPQAEGRPHPADVLPHRSSHRTGPGHATPTAGGLRRLRLVQ
ncbi:Acg family FMN-binding oxidoreductase [Aquabacterium sp. J223]|uniref:Acg family FMN-binding oxidoreductase n=1 Tax=Aquabacterium sp. J223 TaxID=2898431 RepID=UPI0021AE01B1|nr:twin-arginine translocation pathway signal protein [Aquabacterium sp. J223]UUX94202.1 twin-arginine translocation pathway signal protein [Aquabacterium sp. J223]